MVITAQNNFGTAQLLVMYLSLALHLVVERVVSILRVPGHCARFSNLHTTTVYTQFIKRI